MAAGSSVIARCRDRLVADRVAVLQKTLTNLYDMLRHRNNGVDVTLYEREAVCGGHTLTDDSAGYPVDVGFQVSSISCNSCTVFARSFRGQGCGVGQPLVRSLSCHLAGIQPHYIPPPCGSLGGAAGGQ